MESRIRRARVLLATFPLRLSSKCEIVMLNEFKQAGGGGMVFSKNVILKMLADERCKCPTPSHHDDIHLVILF